MFHFLRRKESHLPLKIIAAFHCFPWLAKSRKALDVFLAKVDADMRGFRLYLLQPLSDYINTSLVI